MTTSQEWYTATTEQLISLVGTGAIDPATGYNVPNISSLDTVALLGVITPVLARAITNFCSQTGHAGSIAARSDLVDSTGAFLDIPLEAIVDPDTAFLNDVKVYLQNQPDPTYQGQTSAAPWRRYPVFAALPSAGDDTIQSYEVYSGGVSSISNQSQADNTVLQSLRQAIADWQRMVQASASAIYANSADTTNPAPLDDVSEFMSALRGLCSDLDVLQENPPALSVVDALRDALAKASEFTGKALADVSDELGKQIGIALSNFSSGFIANAGIVSIIVVGLVIHLYM